MLIASLYPEGKILHYFIITKQRSAPLDVLLQKLLGVMQDPPFGVQRRPTHISFHGDTGEAAKLNPFLRKLEIVSESLSLAPGTMDYVREVASTLRGGPEPPITGPIFFSSGIPMWQWRALLHSSSVLVGGDTKKKDKKHVPPWLGMPTHLKARHLVVNIRIDRVGSQISIRDNFPLHAGDTIWLSLLHDDGGVLGVALFPSKLDCEARMKDPSDTLDDIFRETTECSYEAYKRKTKAAQETRTNESRKLKHLKPRQFDVRDGLELAYSSTEALRAHWHVVKSFSRSLDERNEGILNNRKWWNPHGEAILMWRGINTLSFDEIDFLGSLDMDGFGTTTINPTVLQRLGVNDKNIVPVPMALKEGSFGACSLEQISWLTIGCCAASCLVNFFGDIRNVGDAVDAAKVKSIKQEIPYRYGHMDNRIEQEEGQNENETISSCFVNITVTYDPVLLKNEVSACS